MNFVLLPVFPFFSQVKFLVFCHHSVIMDALENKLISIGAGHIRIDGKTRADHRQALASQFQADPRIRVALLSITAAGTGLTLTSADTVVFAELYWTPGALLQVDY